MLLQEVRFFNELRSTPPDAIVEMLGRAASKEFAKAALSVDALPVVVPVKNEAEDLPALLATLAESERPVVPVVVNNGSTDRTVERALGMGAHVLEWPNPGKMGATQLGIQYATKELRSRKAVFTDGDTLIRAGWAGAMERRFDASDSETGVAVFGTSIYAHGESSLVDVVRTSSFTIKSIVGRARGMGPRAVGHNYGLRFDDDGAMVAGINGLEPGIFVGDDRAIRDVVTGAGARIVTSLGIGTMVMTRGDRMGSFRDLLQPDSRRDVVRRESYEEQYGVMAAYTGDTAVLPSLPTAEAA
jgi:glycosyltransferase involved in cell wall biosynthesis